VIFAINVIELEKRLLFRSHQVGGFWKLLETVARRHRAIEYRCWNAGLYFTGNPTSEFLSKIGEIILTKLKKM
jgi:hypothetical protein